MVLESLGSTKSELNQRVSLIASFLCLLLLLLLRALQLLLVAFAGVVSVRVVVVVVGSKVVHIALFVSKCMNIRVCCRG